MTVLLSKEVQLSTFIHCVGVSSYVQLEFNSFLSIVADDSALALPGTFITLEWNLIAAGSLARLFRLLNVSSDLPHSAKSSTSSLLKHQWVMKQTERGQKSLNDFSHFVELNLTWIWFWFELLSNLSRSEQRQSELFGPWKLISNLPQMPERSCCPSGWGIIIVSECEMEY